MVYDAPSQRPGHGTGAQGLGRGLARLWTPAVQWLARIDPGTHRRIKGLRLVTAFGLAAMLGKMPELTEGLADSASLSTIAGGFALWASVSESRSTRAESSRDLLALCTAAAFGAAVFVVLAPLLAGVLRTGAELTLATGAFCVGYLRRFGILGTGIGSQIYIGQLLAYVSGLTSADYGLIAIAGVIAALSAIVPRVLSGPAEHPVLPQTNVIAPVAGRHRLPTEFIMGLQAAIATLAIVGLNDVIGLAESAWAITACTYVVANSMAATLDRIRRRIFGTAIGVPLGLLFLPISADAPLLIWTAAALAMIIYAMSLPERYDVACGAYAFALVVTLAVSGEHSISMLIARFWETLIGGALGLAVAMLAGPLLSRIGSRSVAGSGPRMNQ